jgi:hypothetical protein
VRRLETASRAVEIALGCQNPCGTGRKIHLSRPANPRASDFMRHARNFPLAHRTPGDVGEFSADADEIPPFACHQGVSGGFSVRGAAQRDRRAPMRGAAQRDRRAPMRGAGPTRNAERGATRPGAPMRDARPTRDLRATYAQPTRNLRASYARPAAHRPRPHRTTQRDVIMEAACSMWMNSSGRR